MRDIRANVQNRQNQYKSAFESFAARVTSMSRDVNDVEIMVRIVEMVPGLKDSARQMDKLANNQTLVNLIDAKLKGWQKTISSDEGFQSRLRNAQKRTANENLRKDQIKLQKAEDELARAEKKLKTLQEGYAEELKKSAETVRVRMEEQAQALTGTDQALFAAEDQALSALRQTAVGGKSVRKMIADVFEGETIRGAEEQLRAAETECLQARKKWLENVREPDQRMAKMKEDRDRKKSKIEEIQAAIRAGRAVLQELEG